MVKGAVSVCLVGDLPSEAQLLIDLESPLVKLNRLIRCPDIAVRQCVSYAKNMIRMSN